MPCCHAATLFWRVWVRRRALRVFRTSLARFAEFEADLEAIESFPCQICSRESPGRLVLSIEEFVPKLELVAVRPERTNPPSSKSELSKLEQTNFWQNSQSTMHNAILLPLTLCLALISATIDIFAPFSSPNLIEAPAVDNSTLIELELAKRQNCNSCSTLNAASVCCTGNGYCTYDWAGHVACCWLGTSCTGTISGTAAATGTVTTTTGFLGAISGSTTTLTSPTSTVTEGATTTGTTSATGIVVIQGTATVSTGAGAALDAAWAAACPTWIGFLIGMAWNALGR